MHQGCVAGTNEGGRERRVVADIAKLSVGREEYYTRELATDHEAYLSWPRRESRTLVRRRRRIARLAGRSIRGRLPGHVRRPPPDDWRAARPSVWPQRRARL